MNYGNKFANKPTGKPVGGGDRPPSLKNGFFSFIQNLVNIPFEAKMIEVPLSNGKVARLGGLLATEIIRKTNPNIDMRTLDTPDHVGAALSSIFPGKGEAQLKANLKNFANFTEKMKPSIYKEDNVVFVETVRGWGLLD